jgi:hypothetical protein
VVDTRGVSRKPEHAAVDFQKIHLVRAIFGNFLDFFQKFFGRLARALRVSHDTGS